MLLALGDTEERQIHAIVAESHEWQWDLLDIVMTRGHIPASPQPMGAIVDCRPSDPLAKRLLKMGLPVVRLGRRPCTQDAEVPAVLPDHAAAGKLAVAHFAERGFERVAYESSVPWVEAYPLYDGFLAAAREQGMGCDLCRMGEAPAKLVSRITAAEHDRRAREIGEWLQSLPKPVGVLSFSAGMLCGICSRVGHAVPEEVALLGVGNHLLPCELSPVPLSSIDTAAEEQARQAARLLKGLMEGDAVPDAPLMVPPRGVVTRRSTDVLAVGDPVVSQAMQFMWGHLDADLSVADVATHAGVSSRSLQRAFKIHLHRGVIEELRRRRLQELRRLLRRTDQPIADLAPQVGFRTLVHMHKCFRDTYGMTPRQYRKKHRAL